MNTVRLELDFFLRSLFRVGRPIRSLGKKALYFSELQQEVLDFLSPIRRDNFSVAHRDSNIVALDVGARDFFMGPALERFLLSQNIHSEIHGIEIDAYRRLINLRTRKDYGEYFAKTMQRGRYHAIDFLKWQRKADFIFLMNPFVSLEPLLQWQLPKRLLQPEKIFRHAAELLKPDGRIILCCPSEEEQQIADGLAKQNGWRRLQTWSWEPSPKSIQKYPRLGSLWMEGPCPSTSAQK